MKPTAALAFVLVLVSIAAGGCASAAPPTVTGRTFLSTGVLEGDAPRPLVPGTRIRLSFGGDGNLGVNAGCNAIGGTYGIVNGVLTFDGAGMTDMGCDEPRHAQDEWIVKFLASRPAVTLSGENLAIAGGGVVLQLLDEEVADPDLPLAATLWTVDSIISDDMAMGLPADVAGTLQFGADGQVAIFTGCNQGSARVATDGATLVFSDLILTRRGCDGAAGEMEAGMLAVLRSPAVGFTIDAGTLMLDAGNRGLTLRGG